MTVNRMILAFPLCSGYLFVPKGVSLKGALMTWQFSGEAELCSITNGRHPRLFITFVCVSPVQSIFSPFGSNLALFVYLLCQINGFVVHNQELYISYWTHSLQDAMKKARDLAAKRNVSYFQLTRSFGLVWSWTCIQMFRILLRFYSDI